MGASPIDLFEVTAADSAAATVQSVEELRGRQLLLEKSRNLNRRSLWLLVSVEKDSHAQPPLAAMAVFPLPALPPKKQRELGEICEGGGFSERSPSLALPPEERLAFGAHASSDLVPPVRWARLR